MSNKVYHKDGTPVRFNRMQQNAWSSCVNPHIRNDSVKTPFEEFPLSKILMKNTVAWHDVPETVKTAAMTAAATCKGFVELTLGKDPSGEVPQWHIYVGNVDVPSQWCHWEDNQGTPKSYVGRWSTVYFTETGQYIDQYGGVLEVYTEDLYYNPDVTTY